MEMRKTIVVLGLLFAACVTVRPPSPTGPAAPARFKNLRVLPSGISHDDLIATMRAWSRSLGANCAQCHVRIPPAQEGGRTRLDFVSDANSAKNAARAMFRMTNRMNVQTIARVAEQHTSATCYTCHRGKVVPDSTLPPSKED